MSAVHGLRQRPQSQQTLINAGEWLRA